MASGLFNSFHSVKKGENLKLLVTVVLTLFFASNAISEEKISVNTNGVKVNFKALTQLWLTATVGREEPRNDVHTYKLRRSELQLSAEILQNKVNWLVMADVAEDADEPLQDLFVNLHYIPKIGFRVGQFKFPLGMEPNLYSGELDFIERTNIFRRLSDRRDAGAMLFGLYKIFEFYFGEFNGSSRNRPDRGTRKDLVGRAILKPLKGVAVGASGYMGDFYEPYYIRLATEAKIDYKRIGFRAETIWGRNGTKQSRFKVGQWGGYASFLYKPFEKHQVGIRFELDEPNNLIYRNASFITTIGYNFFQTDRIKWQINVQNQAQQLGNNENIDVYFGIVNLQISF